MADTSSSDRNELIAFQTAGCELLAATFFPLAEPWTERMDMAAKARSGTPHLP